MNARLFYFASRYPSHARVAESYAAALSNCAYLVSSPESANVIILHTEPWRYRSLYRKYPWLRDRYVIAYAVWEASDLPALFVDGLQFVQEVWTCSEYCRAVFSRYHRRVRLIPHIVERSTAVTAEDRATVMNAIAYEPAKKYYLAFAEVWNKRKNLPALLDTFHRTRKEMPDARLIVKTRAEEALPFAHQEDSRVIHLTRAFTHGEINVLYRVASCFVSAHRSEGWGLCISDAMVFGVPVIASGYSGPVDYLSENNSWIIPCSEVTIGAEDEYHFFTRDMKWGEPNVDTLFTLLQDSYQPAFSREARMKSAEASRIADVYSAKQVEVLIRQRVEEITCCFL